MSRSVDFPPSHSPSWPSRWDLGELSRDWTPLRVAFLHPLQKGGGTGPLAQFVRARREVALDLLLLTHALRPLTDRGEIAAPASDWAQALGIAGRPGSRALISRSWSWLQDQKLITSRAVGQLRGVEALREDGSGRPWEHPFDSQEPYFKLPITVWQDGLWRGLSLPAKAVLMIGLSLERPDKTFFELPIERGGKWYGLTPRTIRSGLRNLRDAGWMHQWTERREAPNSPIGYRYDRHYSVDNRLTPREVTAARGPTVRDGPGR